MRRKWISLAIASIFVGGAHAQDIHLTADSHTAVLDGQSGHCAVLVASRAGEPEPGIIYRASLSGYDDIVLGDQAQSPEKYTKKLISGKALNIRVYREHSGIQEWVSIAVTPSANGPQYTGWVVRHEGYHGDHYMVDVYDYPSGYWPPGC